MTEITDRQRNGDTTLTAMLGALTATRGEVMAHLEALSKAMEQHERQMDRVVESVTARINEVDRDVAKLLRVPQLTPAHARMLDTIAEERKRLAADGLRLRDERMWHWRTALGATVGVVGSFFFAHLETVGQWLHSLAHVLGGQ